MMRGININYLKEYGLIEPEEERAFLNADADVKALLARWAIWYNKPIKAGAVAEILSSQRAMQHARDYRKMLVNNNNSQHLRLVS